LVIEGGRYGVQKVGQRDQLRGLRLVEPTPRRDLAVSKSLEYNRSLKMMMRIEKSPTRRIYDPEGL